MSIASSILAIVMIFLSYSDVPFWLSADIATEFVISGCFCVAALAFSVAGLVLGILSMRRKRQKSALVGIILGAIVLLGATMPLYGWIATYPLSFSVTHPTIVVDYTATAREGKATVTYTDSDGKTLTEDFSGTWSKEVVVDHTNAQAWLIILSKDDVASGAEKTCQIKLSGQVADEKTDLGDVYCLATLPL